MDERQGVLAHYRRQIAHYTDKLKTTEYGDVQRSAMGWIEFYKGMIAKYGETAQ